MVRREDAMESGEIHKRVPLLNTDQIQVIAEDYPQGARHRVWIRICKQYPFVADFVTEVGLG